MSKVYIFLADGFEDIEGLTVLDLMRRAGISVDTVSIKETRDITTSHGIEMKTDRIFHETDFWSVKAKAQVNPVGWINEHFNEG